MARSRTRWFTAATLSDVVVWIVTYGPVTGTSEGEWILDLAKLAGALAAIGGTLWLLARGVWRLGQIVHRTERLVDVADHLERIDVSGLADLPEWRENVNARLGHLERRDNLRGDLHVPDRRRS